MVDANDNFVLKCGWPFTDHKDNPLKFKIRSSLIVPIVGTFSRILVGCLNNLEVHNVQTLRKFIGDTRKRPLITVSNHYSCIDDPGVWAILRWRDLWSANKMRWSLAAHDICFTNRLYSWFFSSGKCIPIIRGIGVYQQGIDFCIDRLNEGSWVHIFPEGKVNLTLENIRLKWGVGRMVYESKVTPIIIPFYHLGMDSVLPNKTPYIPRLFRKVTVVVGNPLDYSEVVEKLRSSGTDETTARKILTNLIQEELKKLREKAEIIHLKRL